MINNLLIKTIHVEYTTGCNSKCLMCDYWKNCSPETIDNSILYKNIAEQYSYSLRTVYFSGGECLLAADELFPLAEQLKKDFPHLRLKLITNGLLLDKYYRETAAVFSTIIVSLDTVNRTIYEKMRGIDGLNTVIKGIQSLRKNSPETKINLRALVLDENVEYLKEIIDFANENSINKISFLPEDTSSKCSFGRADKFQISKHYSDSTIISIERAIEEIKTEYPGEMGRLLVRNCEDLDYIRSLYSGVSATRRECNKAICSCVIGADKLVSPCFFARGNLYISEDVSLQKILASYEYIEMVSHIYAPKHGLCGRCACPKILS